MKELLLLSLYLVFVALLPVVSGPWYVTIGIAAIFGAVVFGIMCAMAPDGEADW